VAQRSPRSRCTTHSRGPRSVERRGREEHELRWFLSSPGRVRDGEARRRCVVQLWADSVRLVPYGPCEVSSTLDERAHELMLSVVVRNYMTQDIMRRILRDYFGYEVNFVMNITDVDDKVSPSYRGKGNRSSSRSPDHPTSSTVPSPHFLPRQFHPLDDCTAGYESGMDDSSLQISLRRSVVCPRLAYVRRCPRLVG
jgi:hypothetical protein